MSTAQLVRSAFLAGGLVSRSVPGFEERPQQVDMALAVFETLTRGGRLLVEAGTGVGKSLAYLVPAALWAAETGKRVIVSTHTVNLQEQLISKDIPLVHGMLASLGLSFEYMLLKGRNHYICLRRWKKAYEETRQTTSLVQANEAERAVEGLFDLLSDGSWNGDRDSLPRSVPDSVWSEICSEGDRCMGSKCLQRDACPYQEERKRLEKCHLIVVNHALFAADLAIRAHTQGQTALLPGYEAAVFDEAHHLEDVVRDSLGTEVSPSRLKRLADDTMRLVSSGSLKSSFTSENARSLRASLDDLVESVSTLLRKAASRAGGPASSASKDRVRLLDPDLLGEELPKLLRDFAAEIGQWEELDLSDEERFEAQAIKRRYAELAKDVESINRLEGNGDSFVYWSEREEGPRRSQTVLKRMPLEVGPYLREELWSGLPAAVLTSATLSVDSKFDYVRDMLGMESASEMVLGSPFDFREQACLCVPRDSASQDVNSPAFDQYVAEKVLDIVDMTQGRAFVLFTRQSSMEAVAKLVRDKVEERGYPFLMQGEAPRDALLRRFKELGNAVLFGLDSFWEGVDVPGDALSCVVLAKLPFPAYDDPVTQAREELWKQREISSFTYYMLPTATLKLKQGFGRLIRTKSDRGAVVLLDPRIITRAYGKTILRSLPPARLTFDLEDVAAAVPPAKKAEAVGEPAH